ncbi:Hypothetical_protein [Hexamita inflata]|uniref:Hypothetical_protein n=1 Tax=Hexamita inflata TaxID=28002 RepID=A0AA86RIH5_9EUKA|nr:Hypothetical protein HINF_LOCUS60667 [Hexamita inflata]
MPPQNIKEYIESIRDQIFQDKQQQIDIFKELTGQSDKQSNEYLNICDKKLHIALEEYFKENEQLNQQFKDDKLKFFEIQTRIDKWLLKHNNCSYLEAQQKIKENKDGPVVITIKNIIINTDTDFQINKIQQDSSSLQEKSQTHKPAIQCPDVHYKIFKQQDNINQFENDKYQNQFSNQVEHNQMQRNRSLEIVEYKNINYKQTHNYESKTNNNNQNQRYVQNNKIDIMEQLLPQGPEFEHLFEQNNQEPQYQEQQPQYTNQYANHSIQQNLYQQQSPYIHSPISQVPYQQNMQQNNFNYNQNVNNSALGFHQHQQNFNSSLQPSFPQNLIAPNNFNPNQQRFQPNISSQPINNQQPNYVQQSNPQFNQNAQQYQQNQYQLNIQNYQRPHSNHSPQFVQPSQNFNSLIQGPNFAVNLQIAQLNQNQAVNLQANVAPQFNPNQNILQTNQFVPQQNLQITQQTLNANLNPNGPVQNIFNQNKFGAVQTQQPVQISCQNAQINQSVFNNNLKTAQQFPHRNTMLGMQQQLPVFDQTQSPINLSANVNQSIKNTVVIIKNADMKFGQFNKQILEFLQQYLTCASIQTTNQGDINIVTTDENLKIVLNVVNNIKIENHGIQYAIHSNQ